MLRNLKIRKYALIDTLDIEFHRGFSVITGETGAGKSIMLGAINLILGGRADAKFIKDGAEKCFVEAVFEENNEDIATFFSENDFDYDGKECVVRLPSFPRTILIMTAKNVWYAAKFPNQAKAALS